MSRSARFWLADLEPLGGRLRFVFYAGLLALLLTGRSGSPIFAANSFAWTDPDFYTPMGVFSWIGVGWVSQTGLRALAAVGVLALSCASLGLGRSVAPWIAAASLFVLYGVVQGAVGLGVDLIEFDVHPTRDGKIVVIHDPTLERTTTGAGAVADHEWSELEKLRLKEGGHDRIPLFDEVIDLIKPTPLGLRMEIKMRADATPYPGLEAMLAERLEATGMLGRTVVTSFAWETLKTFGALAEPAGFIALVKRGIFDDAGGIEGAGKMVRAGEFAEMGAPISCLGADSVARARDLGLRLGAFSVRKRADIENALKWGVNVFTTDRPDLAMTLRRRLYGV